MLELELGLNKGLELGLESVLDLELELGLKLRCKGMQFKYQFCYLSSIKVSFFGM